MAAVTERVLRVGVFGGDPWTCTVLIVPRVYSDPTAVLGVCDKELRVADLEDFPTNMADGFVRYDIGSCQSENSC
jgi:hypothetical protein